MVVPSPSAPSPLQPSRRTVVGAGLIAVPAVTMLSAAPAYAAASDERTFTITTPSGTVPASGSVPVTVTVLAPNGMPVTGVPISLVGPSQSLFLPDDGVTDGSGTFTATLQLNTPWATPGSSTLITAVTTSGSGSASFTVLGANMLMVNGAAATQAPTQFSSPIVRAHNGPGLELVVLQDGTVWNRSWNSDSPHTQVAGISDGADLASALGGGGTFYVLKKDGTVWGWGNNTVGQLGDGTTTNRSTPVQVQNLSGVTKIAASNSTLFALKSDKTLWSIGNNGPNGQAGIGTSALGPLPPTQVSGGTNVVDIASNSVGGMLVKADGTVWVWGIGGENGDGTTTNQLAPVQLTTLSNITSITSSITGIGRTTFALSSTGTVYSWGSNAGGAYGDNTTTDSPTPIQISGLSGITQITTSRNSVVALKNDGTLLKWGGGPSTPTPYTSTRPITRLGNYNGDFYNYRSYIITAATTLSVDVTQAQVAAGTAGTVVATVAAGSSGVAGANVTLTTNVGTLAATSGATNSSGVLQTTVMTDAWTTPGTVARVTAADDTGTSFDTFTVLGSNLVVWMSQMPPGLPSPVVDYSMLWGLAVLADGSVWQAGGPNNWVVKPEITNAARVSGSGGGADSVYVLKKDGTIVGWGTNNRGQLGDGTMTNRTSPVVFQGLDNVTQIQAGVFGLHALKSDGTVWYQGSNLDGRGGVGLTTTPVPLTQVVLPARAVQVVNWAGYTGGAVLEDGTVWTWGSNGEGQLGDGTTTQQNSPVRVLGLSGIIALTGSCTYVDYGGANYLALKNDGTVWSWGRNEYGQLGYGGTTASSVATQVPGLSNVTQIATSPSGSYALKDDGTFLTWGLTGAGGNVARSTPTARPAPRPIAKLLGTHGHAYNIQDCPFLVTTI